MPCAQRRSQTLANAPAGNAKGLGIAGHGDRPLAHARQRSHADVLAFKDEIFVNLVGKDEKVMPLGEMAIHSSSSRVKTLPEGLAGEFSTMARVRNVTERSRSSRLKVQSGALSVT